MEVYDFFFSPLGRAAPVDGDLDSLTLDERVISAGYADRSLHLLRRGKPVQRMAALRNLAHTVRCAVGAATSATPSRAAAATGNVLDKLYPVIAPLLMEPLDALPDEARAVLLSIEELAVTPPSMYHTSSNNTMTPPTLEVVVMKILPLCLRALRCAPGFGEGQMVVGSSSSNNSSSSSGGGGGNSTLSSSAMLSSPTLTLTLPPQQQQQQQQQQYELTGINRDRDIDLTSNSSGGASTPAIVSPLVREVTAEYLFFLTSATTAHILSGGCTRDMMAKEVLPLVCSLADVVSHAPTRIAAARILVAAMASNLVPPFGNVGSASGSGGGGRLRSTSGLGGGGEPGSILTGPVLSLSSGSVPGVSGGGSGGGVSGNLTINATATGTVTTSVTAFTFSKLRMLCQDIDVRVRAALAGLLVPLALAVATAAELERSLAEAAALETALLVQALPISSPNSITSSNAGTPIALSPTLTSLSTTTPLSLVPIGPAEIARRACFDELLELLIDEDASVREVALQSAVALCGTRAARAGLSGTGSDLHCLLLPALLARIRVLLPRRWLDFATIASHVPSPLMTASQLIGSLSPEVELSSASASSPSFSKISSHSSQIATATNINNENTSGKTPPKPTTNPPLLQHSDSAALWSVLVAATPALITRGLLSGDLAPWKGEEESGGKGLSKVSTTTAAKNGASTLTSVQVGGGGDDTSPASPSQPNASSNTRLAATRRHDIPNISAQPLSSSSPFLLHVGVEHIISAPRAPVVPPPIALALLCALIAAAAEKNDVRLRCIAAKAASAATASLAPFLPKCGADEMGGEIKVNGGGFSGGSFGPDALLDELEAVRMLLRKEVEAANEMGLKGAEGGGRGGDGCRK